MNKCDTMNFETVTQAKDAVSISDVNLVKVSFCKQILENPTYWHKFSIVDVHGLKRDTVLKIIFEHVKPFDLIPLSYTEEGTSAYFFARICGRVIEKLCADRLTIQNPFDKNKPLKLKITLKYSSINNVKVDLSRNVLKVLQKRLNNYVLCLNNFSEDSDLTEFTPLSQPKLLAFVLNISRKLKPKIIKLCHNEIKSLDALRIMAPDPSILSLDLRHNLIQDLAELKYLENFGVTELWLEGNPLCELYDEYNYVQHVIKYCPKIEKLDGFLLRQNGVPSFRRNFLCDVGAHDVIDRFLERYFTTYDSKNFADLEALYHEKAMFSMTAEFFQKQLSSATSQVKTYKLHSRNLRHLLYSSSKNLYMGRNEILNLFKKFPWSEHDPYSFTVDVLMFSEKSAVIVVTGVFREIPGVERLLGFNRNFVLECCNGSYYITNEQLHVFNALTSQQVTAFKKSSVLQEARNPTQQTQMINTFAIITNLTKDWAKLFLEECQYNLKHAMLLFVDLYKSDKIPSQGFKSA